MSVSNFASEAKANQRVAQQIEQQIDQFINRGGIIQIAPYGASGITDSPTKRKTPHGRNSHTTPPSDL